RVRVDGPVTFDTVGALLRTPVAWPQAAVVVVDLAAVGVVDSAVIALLLAWQRDAAAAGRVLRLAHPPAAVASLAALYGVDALLPEAA
ncbi:MAG: STAS domain-containing protein, partial [Burkholderiales bacterium]|nr:STAS domain-containing protein [Burkholderiales bacterium]